MSKNNVAAPGLVRALVGQLRAFVCHETYLNVQGFCFAKSAGKARMIAARSAWDAGYPANITTIKVRRHPALDGRVPADYRNGFFSMEHAEHLPLPNADITAPCAQEVSNEQ
jgi:hypothetical protein